MAGATGGVESVAKKARLFRRKAKRMGYSVRVRVAPTGTHYLTLHRDGVFVSVRVADHPEGLNRRNYRATRHLNVAPGGMSADEALKKLKAPWRLPEAGPKETPGMAEVLKKLETA